MTHRMIISNLGSHLRSPFSPCFVFLSTLRVQVPQTDFETIPDVVVASEEPRFNNVRCETLLNPRVLVEVFTPTTEADDRGTKFARYRTIESVSEYLLVAQDQPCIEQYSRQPSGDWLLHVATKLDETVRLPSLDCDLKLADVYARVKFSETE